MRFTNVTLPMLAPDPVVRRVVLTSRAFQSYGEFDLLTGGGPNGSTTSLTYLVYGNNSIIKNNSGLQAAVAVLLFVVLLVLSLAADPGRGTAGALWQLAPCRAGGASPVATRC